MPKHEIHCNLPDTKPIGSRGCSCFAFRTGFYWVRYSRHQIVAHLCVDGEWYIDGHAFPLRVHEFDSFGSKILPPDDDTHHETPKNAGFYWAKYGNWVVAHLTDGGEWYICGEEYPLTIDEFDFFGPEIQPPHDK